MADGGVITDSAMGLAEALAGTAAPREVLETLTLLDIRYIGFDGRLHTGQLVVHRDLAPELGELFALMEALKFPLAQVAPIVRYAWSDEVSMAADNSSAFNYRLIAGTETFSRHAEGRALDINPRHNPAVYPDSRVAPAGAVWRPGRPGTFTGRDPVVRAFLARGWQWGGNFDHVRDYHHFEK